MGIGNRFAKPELLVAVFIGCCRVMAKALIFPISKNPGSPLVEWLSWAARVQPSLYHSVWHGLSLYHSVSQLSPSGH